MPSTNRRSVHVERVMGTVVSLDLRHDGDHHSAIADVVGWLHDVDRRFSPYRDDSETCRHSRKEITEERRSPDLAEVVEVCESIEHASGGAFSAWRGGVFDPSAYVKGWSGQRAGGPLREHGCVDWALNVGGDVLTSGAPAPGRLWRIGVQHPLERGALAAVLHGSGLAVATSGTYERGEHILDPRSGRPVVGPVSVTVVGTDLGSADAYSTSAFALGEEGPGWMAAIPGYESMTIWASGGVTCTSGFPMTRHGVPIVAVPQVPGLLGAA